MKDAGIGLIGLGLLAVAGGFFIKVGRSVGYPIGEVANAHAMHIQALVIQGGLFVFLAGVVLFAAGRITETMEGQKNGAIPEAVDAPPSEDAKHNRKVDLMMGGVVVAILIVLVIFFALASRQRQPDFGVEPGALNRALDNGTMSDVMNEPLPPPPPIDMGNQM